MSVEEEQKIIDRFVAGGMERHEARKVLEAVGPLVKTIPRLDATGEGYDPFPESSFYFHYNGERYRLRISVD